MVARSAKDVQTRAGLAAKLRALGLGAGDVVCAHVAMGSLGLVIGGVRTVVEAILDAVGPGGTLMMPAYSGDLSDPAEWRHPPVDPAMIAEIKDAIPAFDPARTPTRGMGAVAEYFRTVPGTRRSPHPQSSFCAFGPAAEALVASHPYDNRFGPMSPLGRLCELEGKVLLLGAPFNTVSLFHLTQHSVSPIRRVSKSAPVVEGGVRHWVGYTDVEYPVDWFEDGVEHLLAAGLAVSAGIGNGCCVAFPAAPAVRTLIDWRKDTGRVPASNSKEAS
ncbi:MAG: AAC(3) family N-acetyltransferase [Bauldia litoralis]